MDEDGRKVSDVVAISYDARLVHRCKERCVESRYIKECEEWLRRQ